MSNLAIARRPDGLRRSRFQLSACVCTPFLVRCAPGLKSVNLIALMNLVMRVVPGAQGRCQFAATVGRSAVRFAQNVTMAPVGFCGTPLGLDVILPFRVARHGYVNNCVRTELLQLE